MQPPLFRARTGAARSCAGTTLVEITISLAVFSIFSASAFLAVNASTQGYRTEAVAARLDTRSRRALDEACLRLRQADITSLTPTPVSAPASAWWIDFQRAEGYSNGSVDWSLTERLTFESDVTDPDDGMDNDGDGLVDEGRLVWIQSPNTSTEQRIVLCSSVSRTLEGEIAGNGLDDNGNGLIDERGFCIEFVGSRLVLRLTLEERDHLGNRMRRTVQRAVTPRTTPEG